MNPPSYKLWSLYIVPLVIFTIFDWTPFFFCYGQRIQTNTSINDTQQHALKPPTPTGNTNTDDPMALQLHKLYVLTLTSNYVVTQTATSYSYSSFTTTVSNTMSSTPVASHPTSSSSNDTAILIGALVGGIGGLFLIGIGLFLIFRKRNGKADPSTSIDSEYGGYHRNSHMRAFVPPLSDPSLSTPNTSIEVSTSQQHHQLQGHPYNISDPLIQQHDTINKNTSLDITTDDRHVPNEEDQVARPERHVPHLVD